MVRKSLAEIEEQFTREAAIERSQREELRRAAVRRSRERELARRHKEGSMRFWVLVLVVLATAVLVTVAMFEALYVVLG